MNSQLLAHMDTFDSDEEYSDYDEMLDEDQTNIPILDPIDAARLKTKAKVRKFVKPKNVNDVLLKVLALFPVAIALGDYIGTLWSLTLSVICLVFLQLRPPPVMERQPSSASTPSTTKMARRRSSAGGGRTRRRASEIGGAKRRGSITWERSNHSVSSQSSTQSREEPQSAAAVLDLIEATKKQVHDCRKETSRLLGLIGAPPLEWKQLDSKKMMIMTTSPRKNEADTSLAGDVNVMNSQIITDMALISIVKFLEGHTQFLLTVDHAFYWMKVSASLHWGLGPHSQCVERVERASIAKEFKNKSRRRSSISASLILEGVNSPLEPHRKVDTSSILALSSTRRNLAQMLVDQSVSLVNTYKQIRGMEEVDDPLLKNRIGDQANDMDDGFRSIIDDGILEMPSVVDLSWIKASRKHLAGLLSYTIDFYCTINGMHVLSDEPTKRTKLDESMWNARNAREYLLCNLLLGKTPSAKPAITEDGAAPDELMMSLLQYRQQLEALNAAIWSCQQYSKFRTARAESDIALNAAEILEQEERAEASRLEWWNQIKELSTTCKDMEREIESKFFASSSGIENHELEDEINTTVQGRPHESGSYEHGQSAVDVERESGTSVPSSKTIVFTGKGAVEKRPITTEPTKTGRSSADPPPVARDTIAEQLMVKELRNRINAVIQLEEEEQAEEEEEKQEEEVIADESEEYEEQIGDSSDDDKVDRELDELLDTDSDDILDDDDDDDDYDDEIIENTVYVGDVAESDLTSIVRKEREATSSLFLGATGSLLGELKQKLPAENDQIGDTYILDDGTEDSSFDD